MKIFVRPLIIFLSAFVLVFSTVAVSKPTVTDYPDVDVNKTMGGHFSYLNFDKVKPEQLKEWGLTDSDFQRYKKLMQGEAGLYFGHLEPINVLGIYAKNNADRERYAKLLVQRDNARVDRLFSFNRAYVKQRLLSSNGKPFDDNLIKEYKTLIGVLKDNKMPTVIPGNQGYKKLLNSGVMKQRYTIVIKRDCQECDKAVRELIKNKIPTDITIVNSNSEQISRWAVNIGINRAMIQDGSISLNRDDAKVFAKEKKFPVIYESGVAQ